MFNFFKDKFKKVLSKFSKKIEEEIEEVPKPEEVKEEVKEKPVEEKKIKEKLKEEKKKVEQAKEKPKEEKREVKELKEEIKRKVKEKPTEEGKKEIEKVFEKEEKPEKVEEIKEQLVEEEPEKKKGFFQKITEVISKKELSEKQFDDLFFELEVVLMENNVALEVIEKIKQDLKQELVEKPILRKKVKDTIIKTLKKSLNELFIVDKINIVEKANEKKPFIICFVGINGSGKTTTIAKICKLLQKNKLKCVIAAADTFRAASIEQLQIHADKLGVRMIKHDYGSDSAAVAYDAIKYAQAKKQDVVLIDTAGRLHSNVNLMDEVKKLVRIAKPDLTLFVGESITGNDCVEQAKKFNEIVGIDGIILAKSDVDEKGGAAISVSYVTKKPILYLGTGQEYDDLKEFDPGLIISGIGL
ncbi:signal recognition particle-docking protein FtsY [Candidatus Woesearchaeota archaeon CG1_02_33_12]|nr:MAG: signal recognition particle-docking protein FtsY [Candidatus Woesearchaeota archaeon CG1_02_33_12]PIN77568.1 MAG: signal recognition particle-docking protein FtsY [Candidatus Woesearchaeota archaeon CG10_big_fil_rev_8_21_14_0_10_33_12]PIU72336.1 MAG: signal recognition particle-docking protein FtsY [Candidatus Woesearchaeota archaeon CG06_land_8_20_14_3_00_33_13]